MFNFFLITFFICHFALAQKFEGYWKTVDGDGISKSIVKIYKTENNQIEGKIYKILKPTARDIKCKKCKGDKKNKPIEGLVIIEDLNQEGYKCKGDEITDPEKGKTYDCKIWIDKDETDILHVRGFWGIFYRTQHWKRVEGYKDPVD